MNRPSTTDISTQSSRKRLCEPAPSSPSSLSDDDDSGVGAKPPCAKRARSLRANSVLGVHVAVTPTGCRRCMYCSDTFSPKTSVGNLRNHLVKKHGIGIVDGPARASPAPLANCPAESTLGTVVSEPTPLESRGPVCAPKNSTLPATEPPTATIARDAIDAIELPTLLANLCSHGRERRLIVAVRGRVRQKDETATLVIADMDALAEIGDTLGATLETIARKWGLLGRLVAVCSNVPPTVSARVETALGVPVLPCAAGLFTTDAVSAAFDDTQVRRIVTRVVSKVMWDPTFVDYYCETRTRFARSALEHASRSTGAFPIPDRDRTASRLLVDVLSPLDVAHDLITHPLMQGVGPIVAVAMRAAVVHHESARRRRQGSMPDDTDVIIIGMHMHIREALAKSIDGILDTDAGLLAVFLDPRTKDLGFIPDAARRQALIARATGLLRSTLRSTAIDTVAPRHGANSGGDDHHGVDKSDNNDKPTRNDPFFANAVSTLFGDDAVRPGQDAQDSGADEIHAYEDTRPAPLFSPDTTPTDPAAWWRERRLIFPNLCQLARAYMGVSAVCVAPVGATRMTDTSAS
ncbi:Zinc-finger incomplete domain containing protein [Pandoravirus quercus]|uniref:Zinc-finger incomplete domain containing protein n=1 Tax=Pandoravirus quercus TaxID=2107709 RepID=A0A2U7UAI3_9VIRU|nr:Zinc-finger incomplete domain containing protein [Pandoravirus quercus]AVK75444.1 Zinc-finger incomplete domain containing protein [Pandoravirus quercus]